MSSTNLMRLQAWDTASGALNVIIETPKGNRNKYAYDPDHGQYTLRKVLPRGMFFPFDFGFIPSTRGEDGDPLDVLVLMDEPAFTGCKIPCRLLGVIEAEQTNADGKVIRNDRLIAVAEHSHDHVDTHSLKEVHDHLVEDIENFFRSYHRAEGGDFKKIAVCGPRRAEKLIRKALTGGRKASNAKKSPANGAAKARKK